MRALGMSQRLHGGLAIIVAPDGPTGDALSLPILGRVQLWSIRRHRRIEGDYSANRLSLQVFILHRSIVLLQSAKSSCSHALRMSVAKRFAV